MGDKVLEKLRQIAESMADSMGYELLLLEETSDRGRRILRIFLDKPQEGTGLSVEDCALFSRALGPVLDVEGDIAGSYVLEVSSPGLNRPLVLPEHFRSHLGDIIQVLSKEPIGERRKFKGPLISCEGEGEGFLINLQVDQVTFEIPWPMIQRAQLDYFATEEMKQTKESRHAASQKKNRKKER